MQVSLLWVILSAWTISRAKQIAAIWDKLAVVQKRFNQKGQRAQVSQSEYYL